MSGDTWSIGDYHPAGGKPQCTPEINARIIRRDNYANGTPNNPRILWLCGLPYPQNHFLRGRAVKATEFRVQQWAREAGFSIVWIFAGPHSTQTMFKPDGKPEVAVDALGYEVGEKRYETADPHITVRAGLVRDDRYGQSFTCMVSGHLYVLLDTSGIPKFDRPMLEKDRKLVELSDYRVDQMWVWQDEATRRVLDDQWRSLLTDGMDREAFQGARLGYKRVHDDGDYSAYYEIHNHTCKKHMIEEGADGEDALYVEKPATGLYLHKALLEKIREAEMKRQRKLREEEMKERSLYRRNRRIRRQ